MDMFVAFGEFVSDEFEACVDDMLVKLGMAGTEDEADCDCDDCDCTGRARLDIAVVAVSGIRVLM